MAAPLPRSRAGPTQALPHIFRFWQLILVGKSVKEHFGCLKKKPTIL
jgi:hypothetical protein